MLKQQQEVVGYDSSQYHSRLLWASSTDGAQVPISLVYRGGKQAAAHASDLLLLATGGILAHCCCLPIYPAELVRLDGSDPLLLEAYGGYGASFDPEFSGGGG